MDTKALSGKDIDTEALNLLRETFGNTDALKIPVDLNRILDHCRLTIRQGQFRDATIEGALDRGNKTIFLSQDDSFENKNFTVAHEIGHLKLHEDVNTEIFTMRQLDNLLTRQGDQDTKEDQADLFAASLLMPGKQVKSIWKATSNDISSMAAIFGVPEVVVKYRLKNLGLL